MLLKRVEKNEEASVIEEMKILPPQFVKMRKITIKNLDLLR